MAELNSLRANNQQTISGPNTGTPKKSTSVLSDLPMASLAPTGSPGDNVFGANPPAPAPIQGNLYDPKAAAAPSPSNVVLGSDEWQQVKLAQAIEQLQRHYAQLASESGGSLQDPYWNDQYDKAVQAEADSISEEASGYRQTASENAANRGVQVSEGSADRATQEKIAADELAAAAEQRKAEEKSAMWNGLATLGMGALTTPYGGTESAMKFIPGTAGSPMVAELRDSAGNIISPGKAAIPGVESHYEQIPGQKPQTGISKVAGAVGTAYKNAFTKAGTNSAWESLALPTATGALAGSYLLPSQKGSKALNRVGAGLAMGGLNAGLDKLDSKWTGGQGGAWSNLISSGLASWADPLNKKSWGKNTAGTALKLGAALGSRFLF